MTDVLDRVAPPDSAHVDRLEIGRATDGARRRGAVSTAGRVLLSSFAIGAALIHFVMVPSHLGEWTAEGVAFLIAGWAQVAIAIAVTRYATRSILWISVALNAAFIGAWVWTRTAGPPWGPNAGVAESAGLVDVACVALEGAFILVAFALLLRPSIGSGIRGKRAWIAALIPLGVLGFATAAIASPSARNHAHGDDHGSAAAGGHTHDESAAGGMDAHDHNAAGDDKGLGMLNNGHHGAMTIVDLDAMTQAKLDGQLAATREVAAMYPTRADAEAAGYTRQGPYSPGLGIHYGRFNNYAGNGDGVMDRNDLLNPMTIIYDGTEPTAKIAGFMYYSFASDQPEGFVGPNDHWHFHTNTCIKPAADGLDAPLGADQEVTAAQCEAVGGSLMARTGWMVHVWSVPGYELTKEEGSVFAEHNPALTCPDGSYFIRPMKEWPDHPRNVCRSAP